jgi:histidine triad (HIT) family protein
MDDNTKIQNPNDNCIFCKIIKGEIPCFKIYENDTVLAYLDIFPANIGHTLVIPKKHAENIFEIDENTIAEIGKVSKIISDKLKNNLGAEGISIFQSNGKSAGQEIMHFHMHLVPRNNNETKEQTNSNIQKIMNLKTTEDFPREQGNFEKIKQIQEKLLQ